MVPLTQSNLVFAEGQIMKGVVVRHPSWRFVSPNLHICIHVKAYVSPVRLDTCCRSCAVPRFVSQAPVYLCILYRWVVGVAFPTMQ